MRYNERIREIREDNALTQQKIADLLHIGQRTYSDYESGKTRIPIDNLLILARFYNVSMDYLSGASDIKTEYPKSKSSGYPLTAAFVFVFCYRVLQSDSLMFFVRLAFFFVVASGEKRS